MEYSIVIPAHNEAANLEPFVTAFVHDLPQSVVLAEIILVENGSKDDTLQACHRLQQSFPELIRVVSIPRRSYGEAIKQGMLETRGTHLSILECDCLDSEFVVDSIRLFQSEESRFIVASKRHPESLDRRPFKRRLLTALYNCFLRRVFGYPGTDTHGLKSIETNCAKELCELAITSDEVFQTEIVLLAWRLGVEILERPIRIRETRQAPVSMVRRFPKVLDTVRELKRSLGRFPEGTPGSKRFERKVLSPVHELSRSLGKVPKKAPSSLQR